MRKIVDSNFLQDNSLEEYLTASDSNYVVITDYTAIEAYKGDTLKSIFKSMSILSKYPDKVIMLKGSRLLAGLIPETCDPSEDFIDQDQTNGFPEFCKDLERAKNGDRGLEKRLLDFGKEANAQMDIMLKDAENLTKGIKRIASSFSEEELSIIKKNEPWTESITEKFRENILLLAGLMIKNHPDIDDLPTFPDLLNSYIFRYSIAAQFYVMNLISHDGFQGTRLEKLRNDVVDLHFVACATFFDGLLTKDKKAENIYTQTTAKLNNII